MEGVITQCQLLAPTCMGTYMYVHLETHEDTHMQKENTQERKTVFGLPHLAWVPCKSIGRICIYIFI